MKTAVFLSHPIQYFSPIWQQLAKDKSLDLTVFYLSDSSLRGGYDAGFGRAVTWDLPLLQGYKSVFLRRDAQPENRWSLYLKTVKPLLCDGGFECVVLPGYSRPFEWQVLWAAKSLGIKVVMRGEFAPSQRNGTLRSMVRATILTKIYRLVDAFAVIGTQARLHLLEHGVSPEKLVPSPYCVDSSLFSRKSAPASVARLRKSLNFKSSDKVVLFSGKLIPRKRPDTLINAIASLRDLPHIKAVLLGDGPLMPYMRALAEKVAPGRIAFAGFVNQSQLGAYFSLADAFVLPSAYETWGLVVNEAMQFGLPVFVTRNVGCASDLVISGKTGEFFETGDAQGLAENLRRYFSKPGLRQKYARHIKTTIKNFTPRAAAQGLAVAVAKATA